MKITNPIITILLICLVTFSCKKNTDETTSIKTQTTTSKVKKEILSQNLQTAIFTITGMTCAIGCAKTIQEELSALDGVQTATVDFDKKLATIVYDKTMQTPESLTKTVETTGDGKTYKVSNMK